MKSHGPKHVAITGASSGIGEAIAREFARRGASLTLVARRKEMLEALALSLNGVKTRVVVHDLSNPDRAADWIDAAEAELGPIDVLVNNAGIENAGPTPSSDLALGVRVVNTNLLTPLTIARAVLPRMIARGSGTIVNVASAAAFSPAPMMAWYAASKAGLSAFSEGLRGEVRKTGVNVVTVYPGPVKTAMADAAYAVWGGRKGIVGMLPEGTTAVLARKIVRAVTARRARVIYPTFYLLTRWFPGVAIFVSSFAPLPPAPKS